MTLFEKKNRDATTALTTLEEILKEPYSDIVRDAAIQRFEYTVEAVWKCLQAFLREREGIECYSPKTCFREAKGAGLLNEQEAALTLEMIDDRNMTSHTYHQDVAEKIFRKLPSYAQAMRKLMQGMKSR